MPGVSLWATNGPNAPMAALSASWNFSQPDTQPMRLANEAVWQSVRGIHRHMPLPHG
jgi:hypothetical protein